MSDNWVDQTHSNGRKHPEPTLDGMLKAADELKRISKDIPRRVLMLESVWERLKGMAKTSAATDNYPVRVDSLPAEVFATQEEMKARLVTLNELVLVVDMH